MKKSKKQQQPKEIFLERKKCNCVGQKHDLINNCLSCGKVVCAQQGEGPCLYCGTVVTRPDGKFIVNDESLFPTLPKEQLSEFSKERSKAILHTNTLVERDQSSTMTQNIYDQHVDYYDVSQNQWIDEADRKQAVNKLLAREKKKEEEIVKHRVVFDQITGQFVKEEIPEDEDEFRQQGRQFMREKESQDMKKKMEEAKSNWDNRLMKNQKVNTLIQKITQPHHSKPKPTQNHLTEYILEDQTQLIQE